MTYLPLISHRLFVAAINDENGARTKNARNKGILPDPGPDRRAVRRDPQPCFPVGLRSAVRTDSTTASPAFPVSWVRPSPPSPETVGVDTH
jgi:hypothetical protein